MGSGPTTPLTTARAQRLPPAAGGGCWPQQAGGLTAQAPDWLPEVSFVGGCGLPPDRGAAAWLRSARRMGWQRGVGLL